MKSFKIFTILAVILSQMTGLFAGTPVDGSKKSKTTLFQGVVNEVSYFLTSKGVVFENELNLVWGDNEAVIYGVDEAGNYEEILTGIVANDEAKKIVYENIYFNIDLVVYPEDNALTYEFIVYPGGNPEDISLTTEGGLIQKMSENGNVLIQKESNEMVATSPLAYQEDISGNKKVINAAGPWVDNLRKIDLSLKGKRLHLTKGVHIVIPHKRIPISHATYFDVADGRMVFAIPRDNIVYLGTTDTNYKEDTNFPYAEKEDVQYILDAANNMFPSLKLTMKDVISTWAGLRPLIHEDGKSPSDLSRKDEIFISESNLISIAGGKLTGFRKMAQRSVDVVCNQLKKEDGRLFQPCSTEFIQLSGGNLEGKSIEEYARNLQTQYKDFDLDKVTALVKKYGSNTKEILEITESKTNNDLLLGEAIYSMNEEMTYNIADFFIRRTGRVYFERNSLEPIIEKSHQFFKEQLYYDSETALQFREDFNKEYEGVVQFKS